MPMEAIQIVTPTDGGKLSINEPELDRILLNSRIANMKVSIYRGLIRDWDTEVR
jgi:hypothetical protein